MAETISPDYLVIGAGAMAMAFVDVLVSDTKATVAMVDRYSRPGGHWLVAYPHVTLHQPSTAYGVNSRYLGENHVNQVGLNKGLAELATGNEIVSYFSKVMQQTFLPSGRVTYYPKHEYVGKGKFQSIITQKVIQVGKDTRIVDATYMKVKVPAMGPPTYKVADGVDLITPNSLADISRPYNNYTVVGAGKTGVDACVWLLTNGIHPKQISWIMPRDSWFLERSTVQPDWANNKTDKKIAQAIATLMQASSPDDLFQQLEASQLLLRVDEKVQPTMFRCAIISIPELEMIKRVGTIIRKGRIISISADEVTLEKGSYKPVLDTIYIDCTADGLAKRNSVPVFDGRRITLQSVRVCQQVFSAAFIAHVEATYQNEDTKNALCSVVPHPNNTEDFFSVGITTIQNFLKWHEDPRTSAWLKQARLNVPGPKPPSQDPAEVERFNIGVLAMMQGMLDKLEHLGRLAQTKE